ncbi:hypothetical protein E2562_025095 [Oryza meyeriana var. granulata]|uniref:Uncharacterized protein n=1 Tax=Oryza meyeriana var. granulata TaxID=110450 RepID=A0A6G1CI77_9ORYZ|nr:hypothetical protein E2562_025095 [Oryza meyeriana var. granulata]
MSNSMFAPIIAMLYRELQDHKSLYSQEPIHAAEEQQHMLTSTAHRSTSRGAMCCNTGKPAFKRSLFVVLILFLFFALLF